MIMGEVLERKEAEKNCSTVRPKHIKGSKERLFIMTQTHNMQIFGVIPFVKLQNDT